MRRYADAAEAMDHYYVLRTCPVPCLDMSVQSARAHGEARTEPVGLDDLLALESALEALASRCARARVAVWLHVRYYKATHQEAMRGHNERVVRGQIHAATIERSTVAGWVDDLDRRFEAQLAARGLLVRNAVRLHHEEVTR